jgi:hypothetical protein
MHSVLWWALLSRNKMRLLPTKLSRQRRRFSDAARTQLEHCLFLALTRWWISGSSRIVAVRQMAMLQIHQTGWRAEHRWEARQSMFANVSVVTACMTGEHARACSCRSLRSVVESSRLHHAPGSFVWQRPSDGFLILIKTRPTLCIAYNVTWTIA